MATSKDHGKTPSQKDQRNSMAINRSDLSTIRKDVMTIPNTACSNCHHPEAKTNVYVLEVPHFKEVIAMCLVCEYCGYTSNEIKCGGPIAPKGSKITLTVTMPSCLQREVIKSETAGISIPELDLELMEGSGGGATGGLYTTVESLIKKLKNQLEEANPFGSPDSIPRQHHTDDDGGGGGGGGGTERVNDRYRQLLKRLQELADGKIFPFTLIITDPLANSFVGPKPAAGDVVNDEGIHVEAFERSFEQNENLGINDVKTGIF